MSKRRFCWIDLEMTGLDPANDRILEAAVIVTNKQLEPVFEWETPVFQHPEVLENMNDWCKHHHAVSGLIDRVPNGITEASLDERLCEIAKKHFKKKNPVVICGNSISQDRKFIDAYLLCLPLDFTIECLMFPVSKSYSEKCWEGSSRKTIRIGL